MMSKTYELKLHTNISYLKTLKEFSTFYQNNEIIKEKFVSEVKSYVFHKC